MGKNREKTAKKYEEELAVFCTSEEDKPEAESLAAYLHVNLYTEEKDRDRAGILLVRDSAGLSLSGEGQTLRGDFTKLLHRIKKGAIRSELLVRASKLKDVQSPTVLDATAGLGEDSFLLAAAGFRVRLYEYDPVISALLRDALRRGKEDPALHDTVCRMELTEQDSIEAMKTLAEPPDVILLDPMFPERQKSALVKKKFQLLHHLEDPCETEEAMLSAALCACPKKVVIKRPVKGPYLAGVKPSYSVSGKAVRYDCIVPTKKEKEYD